MLILRQLEHAIDRRSTERAALGALQTNADEDHAEIAHRPLLESHFDSLPGRPRSESCRYGLMVPSWEVLQPEKLPGAFVIAAG